MFVKVGDKCSDTCKILSGVPQGSVLGPLLFIAYITPIEHLIKSFDVSHVAYADDLTLYVNLQSGPQSNLRCCLNSVNDWFLFNDLLLNPDKSQCLIVGTRHQVRSCINQSFDICGVAVPCTDSVKLLGVTIDNTLDFERHISDVCSATSYYVRALRHIRKHIDLKTAATIASTLIASKLDYCNAILAGVTNHNVSRLQRIQNSAARAVFNMTRGNASEFCRKLHWLPVKQRIDYKISLLCFKILSSHQPPFLFSLLNISKPARNLRSSSNGLILDVPFSKTETSSRAFSVYAPKIWNSLSKDTRSLAVPCIESPTPRIDLFKKRLKTELFSVAYNCVDV